MRTSGNFKDIMRTLEEGPATKKNLDKLLAYLENDNVYNPVFEDYISKRLKDNIHPERLLQLAYNMERSEKSTHLSEVVNERLAQTMINSNECYDQFYFMYRHDTRLSRHIFKALIEKLGNRLDESAISVINTIAPKIGKDRFTLMLDALDVDVFGSFRTMMFMDKLPYEDQYQLACKAFEEDRAIGMRLFRLSNSALKVQIENNLIVFGDEDKLATAIRNTQIPIEQLEQNDFINSIISKCGGDIPVTLGRLYARAEKEGRYEYLLTVCKHKNKKEVLRTICKANDKELIDKFFSIYKNSPEVKHLVPFL